MNLKLTDGDSAKPKYKQLIDAVAGALRRGELREGDALPSLNEVRRSAGVSRDTVVKAYSALKRKGLAGSAHGKEFYVLSAKPKSAPRVLILVDELSMYKQRLVDGIREALGPDAETSVLCHNNQLSTLSTLYSAYRGGFEAAAVIPAYDLPGTFRFLRSFPDDAIVVLDRFSARLGGGLPAVYQDFEPGLKAALSSGLPRLRLYKRVVFLQNASSHIERAIRKGFESFCEGSGLRHAVCKKIEPRRGDVWLVLRDEDLVALIKAAQAQGLETGSPSGLGVVSYNDTPLKEIIEGGVAAVTTDFRRMGLEAGALLKSGEAKRILVETALIPRKTL